MTEPTIQDAAREFWIAFRRAVTACEERGSGGADDARPAKEAEAHAARTLAGAVRRAQVGHAGRRPKTADEVRIALEAGFDQAGLPAPLGTLLSGLAILVTGNEDPVKRIHAVLGAFGETIRESRNRSAREGRPGA